MPATRRATGRVLFLSVLVLASTLQFGVGEASARTLLRGFSDPVFKSADAERNHWLDEAVRSHAGIIRVDVSWRAVTVGGRPANPTDPADPAYDFSAIDGAVQSSADRGLRVLITVQDAPSWAEGEDRPGFAAPGTWKPDAGALGAFAEALGRRYSGSFTPIGSLAPLPEVEHFEPWNEPNLSVFIVPQWRGNKPVSPDIYRRLLNSFYEGVNTGNTSAKVIAGSTGPFGDDGGEGALRVRPLEFMRKLLCLKSGKRLKKARCANEPTFDIYSHHPINVFGGPRKSAQDPDDINAVTDMSHVKRTLHAAERAHTVPRGRHPLWATELFWETKPPDEKWGHPLLQQARWIEDAFYLLWREGVSVGILLQIVDTPVGPDKFEGLQSGLFFPNGDPKPSFTAFRFPFITDRRRGQKKVIAWAIPPASGKLAIEKKHGGDWRTVKRVQARAGKPVTTTLRFGGREKLRAEVGGERSLTWPQLGVHGRREKRGPGAGAASASRAKAASGLEYLLESPPSP
jgi:hypothetical protein